MAEGKDGIESCLSYSHGTQDFMQRFISGTIFSAARCEHNEHSEYNIGVLSNELIDDIDSVTRVGDWFSGALWRRK